GESTAADSTGSSATAAVARRTLAETLTVDGTIGFAGEATAVARLSGTITWLPEVGDVVRRGETLYEVAGAPVALMYGQVPAYRALGEGVSDGEDVRQLEGNLDALGFDPGVVDETFTAATAAAVARWQEDLGVEVTGEVELGRVTFLPGPRRITEIEVTLGEAIGSGGSGTPVGSSAGAEPTATLVAYRPPAVDPGVEAPEPPPAEAGPAPGEDEPGREPGEPDREDEAAPAAGRPDEGAGGAGRPAARPSSGTPEGGADEAGGGEAGSVPVLGTSSTRRVVVVELEPDQQSLARRGQSVGVFLPDGTEIRGEVRKLATVEGVGEEAEAGVEATVVLSAGKRVPALEGATVSVVFTQRVRKDVLSVPVTALLAIGGGRYAVIVARGSGSMRVEVTPGLSADGYVEVSGKGLREGMRVETGE
nr:peptidoglycan-binding protein [Actinomycetota bacterium]